MNHFWNNNSGQTPWLTTTVSGATYVPIHIPSTAPPAVAEPESAVEWLRRRVDETRVGLVA
jgi:hypothetical protein